MTAHQTITLDHHVSHHVGHPISHPVSLDLPKSLEQPNSLEHHSRPAPARTASASVRGPAAVPGQWARSVAATGRSVLDDLADSVNSMLTPTVPQAAAVFLSVLAH